MKLFILLLVSLLAIQTDGACQSCLMDLTMSGMFGHDVRNKHAPSSSNEVQSNMVPVGLLLKHRGISASGPAIISKGLITRSATTSIDSSAMRFLALRKLMSIAYSRVSANSNNAMMLPMNTGSVHVVRRRWAGGLFIEEHSENDGSLQENNEDGEKVAEDGLADSMSEEVMSGSMIMAIGFYKEWISPLLPPACRFLPTCSQYGVQAIKEFGPNKGLILTAWRLARCSPFGGRGYDPPQWPPVAYTYGSY